MRLILALLLLVPTVAAADTPPAAKPKKVCRTEAATGSIFMKRTCKTQAEWDQIETANRQQKEVFRDRTNPLQPPG